MYFSDHNPPHFHARYSEYTSEIDINTLEIIKGRLPRRAKDLKDFEYFKNVEIDDFGGICWPNGYNICPNYLREIIEKESKRIVKRKKLTSSLNRNN